MQRRSQRVLFLCAAFAPTVFALAAEPDSARPTPSAAELVEGIIAQESKIDSVRSLYLRFQGKWTRPPDAIARSIAELKKQRPGAEIKAESNSNLWPEMTEELELAFDKKRVRKLAHWHKASLDLRVFNGERAISHAKYFTHVQEQYALDISPKRFFESPFLDLSCLRMGAHEFWFWKEKFNADERMQFNGLPKDYTLVDRADFRGRPCYVLENRVAHRRVQVGVDDRRLYGLTFMIAPKGVDLLPAINKAAGRTFAAQADLGPWLKKLTQEEQRRFYERFNVEQFVFMRPWAEHVMDDYREIAPGFWFPATQGYTILEVSNTVSHVDVSRELHLVEAKVDEPLADSLFAVELEDGIQVYDWGHDPPLFYKQKADRTPEEWQKIVDEHKQQNDQWKKENASRDALIGQPAPELPKSTWLNTAPLSLASLKGKVVVLDFWATTCGPCLNDLPVAESVHKDAKESGIVVIGVHAAGTEADEIEEFAKKMSVSYPILIDLPPPEKYSAFGLLSSQLSVRGIPYSFVIDQGGNISAHGSLHEVLSKARELANKSMKE